MSAYSLQITENFSRKEFTCPHCHHNNIDSRLVHRLQTIRDYIRQPIIIVCGCRCEEYNSSIEGRPNSYHLEGMAADFCVEDKDGLIDDRAMAKIANEFRTWSGGFHYYERQRWIHIDIGSRRRW